jgi:RNA-binding protein PNO1
MYGPVTWLCVWSGVLALCEVNVDHSTTGWPPGVPMLARASAHSSELHRSPLKAAWLKIYPALVEHLHLDCRMNVKRKTVELRTNQETTDSGALQKGEDFVRAFTLGFDGRIFLSSTFLLLNRETVEDAIALLRLDDLYIETFEIKDVKTLSGDHLARAIGRIAGKDGKTKFAIENASRTRVVLADSKVSAGKGLPLPL